MTFKIEIEKKTSSEWIDIFDREGLPCGPINSITDMHKDPHTIDRKMIVEVESSKAGKSKAIGMPVKFSKTNHEKNTGAPIFGEHTEEVLLKFGYNAEEIKDFKKNGIVA